MSKLGSNDKPLPRLTEHLRTLLRGLYGGINDGLYGELDRIDAYATATECSADAGGTPTHAVVDRSLLGAVLHMLEITPSMVDSDHVKRLREAFNNVQSFAQSASTASKTTERLLEEIVKGYVEWENSGDSQPMIERINEADVHLNELRSAVVGVSDVAGGKP